MKIIFTEKYAKATGICSMSFDDSSKVTRDKSDKTGVDSTRIEYRGRTIGSYSNKIIETIELEEPKK